MDDTNADKISDTGSDHASDAGSERTTDSSSEGEDQLERLIRELQEEDDVVIQGFSGLFNKCKAFEDHEPMRAHPTFNQESPYIDQMKFISNNLYSSVLPQLEEQFKAIFTLLDPSENRRKPGSQRKQILEIQSRLDHTVDQTISAHNSLFSKGVISPDQTNDHLLKETKNYRLYGIHSLIKRLLSNLGYSFCASSVLLIELGFSITRSITCSGSTRESLLVATSQCEKLFKTVPVWLKGSEWDTLPDNWQYWAHTASLDNRLRSIGSDIPPLHERNISLVTLLITISKLSKIFLCKISKIGTSDLPLPHFTEMSTHQLQELYHLAPRAHVNLVSLALMLTEDQLNEALTKQFVAKIQVLLSYFQSASLDIAFYVIPLIPDKDDFRVQNEYKAFLATWNSLWLTAIQNAIKLARSTSINAA
ncbi:hypothetical protein PTTG_12564 [Puccinia triticina 1-1 BBBD Race 1]|uniref:Uncharacterized protein n=1 Tax=Puccinia triticina (isolate 1-1 / race 1 (BBBD)) TaxID=630390 RepID=A0A180GIM8_PUCT1|nr:hypothetical protein PTTG_12564 [Puccinia triticina 1-1 BBBD Race 1]